MEESTSKHSLIRCRGNSYAVVIIRADLKYYKGGFTTIDEAVQCRDHALAELKGDLIKKQEAVIDEFLSRKKEVDGELIDIYMCRDCGFTSREKPAQCPKCMCLAFCKTEHP